MSKIEWGYDGSGMCRQYEDDYAIYVDNFNTDLQEITIRVKTYIDPDKVVEVVSQVLKGEE